MPRARPTGICPLHRAATGAGGSARAEGSPRCTRSRRTTSPAARLRSTAAAADCSRRPFAEPAAGPGRRRDPRQPAAHRAFGRRARARVRAGRPAERLPGRRRRPADARRGRRRARPVRRIVRRPDPADDVDLLLRRVPAAGHRRGSPEPGDGDPAVVGRPPNSCSSASCSDWARPACCRSGSTWCWSSCRARRCCRSFDVPLGGLAAVARLLRDRLHAVCVPDGRLRDDRTHAAGDGAALGALDALRGEPDVVHHGDHRGAERADLAGSLSFFPLTSPVTMIIRLSAGDVPLDRHRWPPPSSA